MSTLDEKLAQAKAEVARLEREVAGATCRELGRHTWVHLGGSNAGCSRDCNCSVPVYQCTVCGDCDYGDNKEADETRRRCAALAAPSASAQGGEL